VPFVSAVGLHAVCITDRIIKHLPNCIKLCERAHLGHAWRVPPASTYVANKTLSISARVRTHNILRVRTTICPYPWEIIASFLYTYFTKNHGSETKGFCSMPCYLLCDGQMSACTNCSVAVRDICCDTDDRQRILLKRNFKEKRCDMVNCCHVIIRLRVRE